MRINIFGDVYFGKQDFIVSDALKKILEIGDRNIVNFEAPIINGSEAPREKVGAVLWHELNAIDKLQSINVTDVCVANNHYYDFGIRAADWSSNLLDKNGFVVHGKYQTSYQEINSADGDIRLAIFNVAESEYGVEGYGIPGFRSVTDPILYTHLAEALRKKLTVILIVHAGLENELSPLRSWSKIYKNFIDFGVTAVIAHHPHVPQRYEYYNNGVIFYSLGNFVFQGRGDSKYNSIGQFVSLMFSADSFSLQVYYTEYKNNSLDLYSEFATLDEYLNSKVKCYHQVSTEDYKKYCTIDHKRFLSSLINKTPLNKLPYFKKRSKREYDFHLHNLRFETHRFVQLEYLEDKLK